MMMTMMMMMMIMMMMMTVGLVALVALVALLPCLPLLPCCPCCPVALVAVLPLLPCCPCCPACPCLFFICGPCKEKCEANLLRNDQESGNVRVRPEVKVRKSPGLRKRTKIRSMRRRNLSC